MPGLTPLAAFAGNWVGGDITGLQSVARALYDYVPAVQDLTGALNPAVVDLTDGARGWQGSAASAFTAAWAKQAATARALEAFVTGIGAVVNGLAVTLSDLESALENEAYSAGQHGVTIGADGNVADYAGPDGLEWAVAYQQVQRQALSQADQAREIAAQELNDLYEQVMNANPHPNVGDAVTMGGLLADLVAAPTADRRQAAAELRKLKGKRLKVGEEVADAEREGKLVPREVLDESVKVRSELHEAEVALAKAGKSESGLSKLLDTRVGDVQSFLKGQAGSGKHAGGNTESDLRAAADEDPGALNKILKAGDSIPVVDVAAALAGVGVGTYADVRGGQPLGSALADETISNTAGAVAANAAAGAVGAEFGSELGAVGGPVGIAVGAVVGYGVGDLAHNLLAEPWGQDEEQYGAVLGTLYGVGHSEAATVDDARELAVGIGPAAARAGVDTGHEAEHLWDDAF
jgi:uncharacterized protein YukE